MIRSKLITFLNFKKHLTDNNILLFDSQYRIAHFRYNNLNKNELRIGFISADFRNHAVSFCLSDFFKELGKRKDIKIYAYSNRQDEDDMTFKLKEYFYLWNNIASKNDYELINFIRKDNLHFLIDLSGFTKGSRVSIFNYRSAKFQLSWIGYLASLGLNNLDFLIHY